MWTTVSPLGDIPPERNCHTLSVAGADGGVYVFGGFGFKSDAAISRFDAPSSTWTACRVAGPPPEPRFAHAAVGLGSHIIFYGGYSPSMQLVQDLPVLSVASDGECRWEWPEVRGAWPAPRAAHTMVADGDSSSSAASPFRRLVLFGGNDGNMLFNDVHFLEVAGQPALTTTAAPASGGAAPPSSSVGVCRWVQPTVRGTPPAPRAGHTAVVLGGRMLVFGGGDGRTGCYGDVMVLPLTPTTATAAASEGGSAAASDGCLVWERPEVSGSPPPAMAGHTATAVGTSRMLVAGGGDTNAVYNSLFALHADTMVWSRVAAGGIAPPPRAGHAAAFLPPHAAAPLPLVHTTPLAAFTADGGGSSPQQQTRDCCPTRLPGSLRCRCDGGRLLVFGGGDLYGGRFSDTHVLDTHVMHFPSSPAVGAAPAAVGVGPAPPTLTLPPTSSGNSSASAPAALAIASATSTVQQEEAAAAAPPSSPSRGARGAAALALASVVSQTSPFLLDGDTVPPAPDAAASHRQASKAAHDARVCAAIAALRQQLEENNRRERERMASLASLIAALSKKSSSESAALLQAAAAAVANAHGNRRAGAG